MEIFTQNYTPENTLFKLNVFNEFLLFTGAFGYFEVTNDITRYTKSTVFETIGKRTPVAIRFSTVGGESGSADTVR